MGRRLTHFGVNHSPSSHSPRLGTLAAILQAGRLSSISLGTPLAKQPGDVCPLFSLVCHTHRR